MASKKTTGVYAGGGSYVDVSGSNIDGHDVAIRVRGDGSVVIADGASMRSKAAAIIASDQSFVSARNAEMSLLTLEMPADIAQAVSQDPRDPTVLARAKDWLMRTLTDPGQIEAIMSLIGRIPT